MPDNNNNIEENDNNEYENYCYLCRRPESKAGKLIQLPGNIHMCSDCIQKSFDSINNNPMQFMDFSKMPNINM